MAPYATIEDVRAICDTDATDAEIAAILDIVSAFMGKVVDLSADTQILRGICMTWAAYRILLKDPNARSLGEYSERRDQALAALKQELDDMISIVGGGTTSTTGVAILARMEGLE